MTPMKTYWIPEAFHYLQAVGFRHLEIMMTHLILHLHHLHIVAPQMEEVQLPVITQEPQVAMLETSTAENSMLLDVVM